jgi:transaldolase
LEQAQGRPAALADEGTGEDAALCFSAAQAPIAEKAGATFVSPSVGRLDALTNTHGQGTGGFPQKWG